MFSTASKAQSHPLDAVRYGLNRASYTQEAYDQFVKTLDTEKLHRFLMPENASLAQGLLEIILDHAWLKLLPSNKGGIAVMLLEAWQVELLTGFNVISQGSNRSSEEGHAEGVAVNRMNQPEYLSIDKKTPTFRQSSKDRPKEWSMPQGVGAHSNFSPTKLDESSGDWLSSFLERDENS